MDNKSSNYFKLDGQLKGSSYQDRNLSHLVDKRGNILEVDGETDFSTIETQEDGTIEFTQYNSESLYENELWLGGSELYDKFLATKSEAINTIEEYISDVQEARRRKPSSAGVSIGYTYHFNVIEVKKIHTDAQLKIISSQVGYQIVR